LADGYRLETESKATFRASATVIVQRSEQFSASRPQVIKR